MRSLFITAVICGLFMSPHITCAQEWTVKLRIFENDILKDSLEFGINYDATDDIDIDLGETELPPLPPFGNLDVRFTGENIGLGLKLDLRKSTSDQKTFNIAFQRSSSSSIISITWDSLPDGEFIIQDKVGGILIDQDMTTTNSLVVTNTNISGLKLFLTPEIEDNTTSIYNDVNSPPREFVLYQNYPNPFNPVTTIKFETHRTTYVKLTVFNTLGQEIARLVDSDMPAGNHSVKWDASREASGIYIYMIVVSKFTAVKKMVVIR